MVMHNSTQVKGFVNHWFKLSPATEIAGNLNRREDQTGMANGHGLLTVVQYMDVLCTYMYVLYIICIVYTCTYCSYVDAIYTGDSYLSVQS